MASKSEYVISFAKRRKSNLAEVLGGKCCICGFNDFIEALEFHHVNPEEKSFALTSSVMYSLDKQLEEAKKCILLCANCHRGVHGGHITIPTNYQTFFNEEQANRLLEENNLIKKHQIYYCKHCGAAVSYGKDCCPSCYSYNSRTVERPRRKELKDMIRSMPFTHIAAQYGVTDNAIRKWCKAEDLPSKKSDISKYTDEEWEKI